jgi:tetratricopeptide (TPR) repeat protein
MRGGCGTVLARAGTTVSHRSYGGDAIIGDAMYMPSRFTRYLLPLAALLTLSPGWARARAQPGTLVENVELKTLTGGKEKLLSNKVKANIFVFFRPAQDRSLDALKQMAACEKEFAGKPVRWVALVSSSATPEEVQPMVTESGIKMPVLIDEGDQLYDKLGIRLHPMVGIADGKGKLFAIEEYRQIQYCEIIKGRIKIALGEMTEAELTKLENPEKGIMPGDDPVKKAARDVNMARRLYEIGQYEKAIDRAKKALEIAPVSKGFSLQAEALAKLGRCAEANAMAEQALKLDPADPWAPIAKAACAGK